MGGTRSCIFTKQAIFSIPQTLKVDTNSSKVGPNFNQKGNTIVKGECNLKSIKPDSRSPDATIKRQVTHSLTRKKTPTNVKANKVKNGPSSSCKWKLKENSIFSFEVGLFGELHNVVDGALQRSIIKERWKKKSL